MIQPGFDNLKIHGLDLSRTGLIKTPYHSGIELIKRLKRMGFVVVRQRGSHIRLEKNLPNETIKLTIPNHKELKKGTLHHILKDAKLKPEDII